MAQVKPPFNKKTSGRTWGGREPGFYPERKRQPKASPLPKRVTSQEKPKA